MSKKDFDKVIEFNKRHYRYNSASALVELVIIEDTDWDTEDLRTIKLDTPQVVDAVGLSRENAEADLMGYIAQWHSELDEEISWEMKFL